MKKIPFTLLTLGLLAFTACKKETPVTANENGSGTENCSLCVGDMLTLNDSGYVFNSYTQQTPYMHMDGSTVFAPAYHKTPDGFYGFSGGMALQFNLGSIDMACSVNKVSFVHARNTTNTNPDPSEINLWLPNVPLMVCPADSLPAALAQWGYTAAVYHGTTQVNMDSSNSFPGVYDSIVVTGPAFTSVRLGANLFESELRSICFSHQ